MNATQQQLQRDLIEHLKSDFQVGLLNLPDCPVFLANAIPRHPAVTGKRMRLPSGRGLTESQAVISAAAEAIELRASLAQNIGERDFDLHVNDGLALVQARSVHGGFAVPLLAQRVFLDWAAERGEPLIEDASSNGCATAASVPEAITRAMLELIERDAMANWWYGRQSRPHIPMAKLDRIQPRLAWWLAQRARQTRLIDITSDIGAPVVAAASAEPDGRRIAIGTAASTDHASALVSAVTEMIQTEVAMTIGGLGENPDLETWISSATFTMPQFNPICEAPEQSSPDPIDPLERLHDLGFQVLAVDLTRQGDPLHTARVVVPGLNAMNRVIDKERLLLHLRANPQFGGAASAVDFETLEPY